MSRLPIVVVVGRPNVGKSTLVNRIVGGRPAVVEEMPGVTRDRRDFVGEWAGRAFTLVDTGGWEVRPDEPLVSAIRAQAEAAVATADAVIFVIDATAGVSDDDMGVIKILRSARIPVILAANKVDDRNKERLIDDLWQLGLGEPSPISAYHGRGVGDLLDRVIGAIPEVFSTRPDDPLPRLAIVGRPNVGKSTLLNRLLGEERVIVSERPGTTRDPIDAIVDIDGTEYRVIDTAGIRRTPQIQEDADYYAVLRARDEVASADLALFLVDAAEGVTQQDQRIAAEVVEAGAAVVLVVNKWDLVDEDSRRRIESDLGDRLGFLGWAPVVRMSALTGSRVQRLGPVIEAALQSRSRRIPTGTLNRLITQWTGAHPPPVKKGRRPRIQYAVQAGGLPPTFVVFVSGGELGEDYLRFLEGRIREVEDMVGTPIHVVSRPRR
jgi:GTPase